MRSGLIRSWPSLLLLAGCFSPEPSQPANETDPGTTTDAGSTDLDPTVEDITADDSSDGPACTAPEIACGGACVDPDSDPMHCGDCDSPCSADEECNAGTCTLVCEAGQIDCGGCVDPTSDAMHCGGCDSPCAADELCVDGGCIPDCDPGLTACGGACIDTTSDDDHCSDCDSPCGPGEHCMMSACIPACPPGMVECDGACVDPLEENAYCGAGLDCVAMPGVACGPMEDCDGGVCELVACNGFAGAAFNAAVTFADQNTDNTEVGIAWDGVSYWAVAGGGASGITEVQYSAAGALLGSFMANQDFRSIFPFGDGFSPLYARAFGSNNILVQDSPGVFIPWVSLTGGVVDSQATVAYDAVNFQFIAQQSGTLSRWDAGGNFVDTVALVGYGTNPGENDFPQNAGVAWADGCYLTYNNGTLSAWNPMGVRVDTATLNGLGANFTANLSMSVANGMVWASDETSWRGYQVF